MKPVVHIQSKLTSIVSNVSRKMPLVDFEKKCLNSEAPLALAVTTTVASLILSLTSIAGNVLIILAVVLDPNKNLRKPFSWLIVNLAVTDLIAGAITNPLSISFHYKLCLGERMNHDEAKGLNISYFISSTASALTIASLAVERYLSVRKPNTYRNTVNNKRIIFTVGAIWSISLSLPIVYIQVGYVVYTFVNINASVVFALLMTIATYALMWRKIRRRPDRTVILNRVISASLPLSIQIDQRPSTAPTCMTTSMRSLTSRSEIEEKVTKMFLVVLVTMFCCYGSATLFTYLLNFCVSCSCDALHIFLDSSFILVQLNASLNFFCYAMQSSRFRSAFIKILKAKRKSHPQCYSPPQEMSERQEEHGEAC